MKTIYFLIGFGLSMFFYNSDLLGQTNECITESDSLIPQNKSYQYCNSPNNNLSNYYLDKNGVVKYGQSPIYTVNIKAHVIQYSESDPRNYTFQDTTFIREGIEQMNIDYSNLQLPSIPVIPQNLEETDTRIRFKVHSIDFIQDTLGWAEISDMSPVSVNFKILDTNRIRLYNLPDSVINHLTRNRSCIKIQNSNSNNGSFMFDFYFNSPHLQDSIDIITKTNFHNKNDQTGNLTVTATILRRFYSYNKYHSNDTNFLHVYFVRNTSECYTNGMGEAYGIGANALRMIAPGDTEIHLNSAWEVNSGGLLSHEVGHCLGSYHTMASQNQLPSYISDVFQPDNNMGWNSCNTTTISNNIMGYNKCRDYLYRFYFDVTVIIRIFV